MANRTVSVQLHANISNYVAKLGAAAKATTDFKSELDGLGKKSPDKFNDIAKAAAGAGIALLGVAGVAVKMATEFDKQMSEVQAVSSATGKELGNLRTAAIESGKATTFSATQAAQAEAELAKAGFTSAQILGGGLRGALSLAAAGQMDLADAATITAQTINAFELGAGRAGHVADVLASAANTSAADMHGLGLGLQQVGLVAHQVGFSMEETVGLLSAFADRGLAGSDGATSLKVAIQRLMAPTAQAKKLMQALGIEVYDSSGKFNSAADIAGSLQKALGGLGESQRNAALYTLFGNDAIRAANIIYTLGADGVKKYTDQVNQGGAAALTAAQKTDNLAGDLERLHGSIETLAIQSGSGVSGGLRFLTQSAGQLVDQFAGLPPVVSSSVTAIAGISGAGLLAAAGLMKARQAATDAIDALREMGPVGGKAATTLGAVTKWGGRAAAVFVGLQVAGSLLSTAMNDNAASVDALAVSLEKLGKTGEKSGELKRIFGGNLGQFRKDVTWFKGGMKHVQNEASFESLVGLSGFDFSASKSLERMKAMDEALAGMVQSGNANEAAKAFGKLADEASKAGIPVDKLRELFPQYAAAQEKAGDASTKAAAAEMEQARALDVTTGSMQAAIDHGKTLKEVWTDLNGTAVDAAHATDQMWQAIDEANKSVKENGRTLDEHTEKGRNNREALLGIASATAEAADKRFADTKSLGDAMGLYEQGRQKFIATAIAMGATKQKAEELANTWMRMPPTVTTQYQLLGVDPATQKVIGLKQTLDAMNGRTVTSYVVVNTVTGQQQRIVHPGTRFERYGGAIEHAQTGLLREAAMYRAGSRPMYAFAEPATKGEAFIPRSGDLNRSRSIADYVVSNWLGGRTNWGGGGSGAGAPTRVVIDLRGDDMEMVRRMRRFIKVEAGGDVQEALGS